MNTYIGVMRQNDEGCGHTIGCGTKVVLISAPTMDDAIEQMYREWYLDEYMDGTADPSVFIDGEFELAAWHILEVKTDADGNNNYVDLIDRLYEARDKFDEAERIREQNRERDEYLRLKAKFGE